MVSNSDLKSQNPPDIDKDKLVFIDTWLWKERFVIEDIERDEQTVKYDFVYKLLYNGQRIMSKLVTAIPLLIAKGIGKIISDSFSYQAFYPKYVIYHPLRYHPDELPKNGFREQTVNHHTSLVAFFFSLLSFFLKPIAGMLGLAITSILAAPIYGSITVVYHILKNKSRNKTNTLLAGIPPTTLASMWCHHDSEIGRKYITAEKIAPHIDVSSFFMGQIEYIQSKETIIVNPSFPPNQMNLNTFPKHFEMYAKARINFLDNKRRWSLRKIVFFGLFLNPFSLFITIPAHLNLIKQQNEEQRKIDNYLIQTKKYSYYQYETAKKLLADNKYELAIEYIKKIPIEDRNFRAAQVLLIENSKKYLSEGNLEVAKLFFSTMIESIKKPTEHPNFNIAQARLTELGTKYLLEKHDEIAQLFFDATGDKALISLPNAMKKEKILDTFAMLSASTSNHDDKIHPAPPANQTALLDQKNTVSTSINNNDEKQSLISGCLDSIGQTFQPHWKSLEGIITNSNILFYKETPSLQKKYLQPLADEFTPRSIDTTLDADLAKLKKINSIINSQLKPHAQRGLDEAFLKEIIPMLTQIKTKIDDTLSPPTTYAPVTRNGITIELATPLESNATPKHTVTNNSR